MKLLKSTIPEVKVHKTSDLCELDGFASLHAYGHIGLSGFIEATDIPPLNYFQGLYWQDVSGIFTGISSARARSISVQESRNASNAQLHALAAKVHGFVRSMLEAADSPSANYMVNRPLPIPNKLEAGGYVEPHADGISCHVYVASLALHGIGLPAIRLGVDQNAENWDEYENEMTYQQDPGDLMIYACDIRDASNVQATLNHHEVKLPDNSLGRHTLVVAGACTS